MITDSGRFISSVQLLIQPEDIGLIVDLWMDKLSSPTLLPPFLPPSTPSRSSSQARGEGLNPQPRQHPLELSFKSPAASESQQTDRRTDRQGFQIDRCRGEDVFTWPRTDSNGGVGRGMGERRLMRFL